MRVSFINCSTLVNRTRTRTGERYVPRDVWRLAGLDRVYESSCSFSSCSFPPATQTFHISKEGTRMAPSPLFFFLFPSVARSSTLFLVLSFSTYSPVCFFEPMPAAQFALTSLMLPGIMLISSIEAPRYLRNWRVRYVKTRSWPPASPLCRSFLFNHTGTRISPAFFIRLSLHAPWIKTLIFYNVALHAAR